MNNTSLRHQALRPRGLRSRPVYMPKVFDNPEPVMSLVRSLAPYGTVATYGKGSDPDPAEYSPSWFLEEPDAAILVQNQNWIDAAHTSFNAAIVRPIRCVINLNPPAPSGEPHLDLPVFRGFAQPEIPIWLLMVMSHSQLFFDWLVPLASGVAWFWSGEGGEFEYWPEGLNGASIVQQPPMWNCGVMSDNEVMWHRVRAIGSADLQAELATGVPVLSQMRSAGAGWTINAGDRTIATYRLEEVRISFVWKAYVFKDDDHFASFENRAFDLHLDQVVEIFSEDLARRGCPALRPTDPLSDETWRAVLEQTYRSPHESAVSR